MEPTSDTANELIDTAIGALNSLLSHLPTIIAVLALLALGWLVARIARGAVREIGKASNQWLMRIFPSGIFSGTRMSSLSVTLLGELVYWAIILIAVTMAARLAGLGSVSAWLERLTAHLPNLIAGMAIVVVGYFVSVFAREQLQTPGGSEGPSANPVPGRIVQLAVFAIALIVGLDQVGIDVTLLIGLTLVCAAAILTAIAVAFATGARTHISNLIGVRTAHAHLSAGMTIKVNGIQGEIVELTATLIALETDAGRVLLPGRLIDEGVITVMSRGRARTGQ